MRNIIIPTITAIIGAAVGVYLTTDITPTLAQSSTEEGAATTTTETLTKTYKADSFCITGGDSTLGAHVDFVVKDENGTVLGSEQIRYGATSTANWLNAKGITHKTLLEKLKAKKYPGLDIPANLEEL